MPAIHLWCPSLSASEGGIESYSLSLAKALVAVAGKENVTVFVRNEVEDDVRALLGVKVRGGARGWPRSFRAIRFAINSVTRALLDRPDLIISTHLNFSPVAALVKRLTNVSYWVSLHGVEAWEIQRTSRRRAVSTADLLLPVSEFTRERVMNSCSIPVEKMRVLHDTFEPERFGIGPKPEHLLRRYGWKAEDPVILTVGRLSAAERYKGHDRVIRALSLVRARVPKVKYLIVGGGNDNERLQQIAEEEKVADAVFLAGRIPHDELPDYYRLCDLFAMPSTGEGFGIVFLEALATGKPVVAGNRDGAVDALRGGELGVLLDPDDKAELAEAMIALLQGRHPHPLANRPEELRARVIEAFGPAKFQQTIAQLLAGKA